MRWQLAAGVAAWLALGTLTGRVSAQSDGGARALAVQLFDEAEELFAAGKIAAACPKYAESYRVDPQLGALVYLAECYEKNGQLASAWASYREAEELGARKGDARGTAAGERARALQGRLNYLVILVPNSARVPGLEILRDQGSVTDVSWGARIAVDAGTRRVVARAPGYQSWEKDVTIAPSRKETTVAVPTLTLLGNGEAPSASTEDPTADDAPPAAPSADAASAPPPVDERAAPSDGLSGRDVVALVTGIAGLGALGASGYLTYAAVSAQNESIPLCNPGSPDDFCDPRGDQLRKDANTSATVATVLTGVGAAAIVVAGVLWFTDWGSGEPESALRSPPGAFLGWSVRGAASSWGLELEREF